jgi:hypothetical protein
LVGDPYRRTRRKVKEDMTKIDGRRWQGTVNAHGKP